MRARTLAPVLILAGVLAQPTLVSAQADPSTNDMRADRDDGDQWGWIGLLGLIGLVGLWRRDRNDVTVTRRTT